MADINSTLLKIKALAEGTSYEYERETALEQLRRLMEKHGVSEQDLDDEAIIQHDFTYKGNRQFSLLSHVMCKVLGIPRIEVYYYRRNGRKIPNRICIKCTMAQKIEIDFLFNFYKELYHKEEVAFFQAFTQKHRIYAEPKDGEYKEVSEEEYLKMTQMMYGMDNVTPYKQLEE